MAFGDDPAEAVDGREVGHVEGHQGGRLAAGGADRVVDLLEAAHGARHQHDLGALAGEAPGHGGADAPRGAANDRDAAIEPRLDRHAQSVSDNSDNWRRLTPPSWSTRAMG